MSWQNRQRQAVDLSTFDESEDYSNAELEAYASAMLRADKESTDNSTSWYAETGVLFEEHLYSRSRREIGNASGIADPTLTARLQDSQKPGRFSGDGQMMYNRTHPRGRKVNSEEQRKKNGASYFR